MLESTQNLLLLLKPCSATSEFHVVAACRQRMNRTHQLFNGTFLALSGPIADWVSILKCQVQIICKCFSRYKLRFVWPFVATIPGLLLGFYVAHRGKVFWTCGPPAPTGQLRLCTLQRGRATPAMLHPGLCLGKPFTPG